MRLKNLTLKDKAIFEKALKNSPSKLSKYSFPLIFLDKAFVKVQWLKIQGSICLFARQNGSCYMLLPPLGKKTKRVLRQCFAIMNSRNQDLSVSRIENIPIFEGAEFRKSGFKIRKRFPDYLYRRKDLAELKGARYKSQRAAVNHFIKNHDFKEESFNARQIARCLSLYKKWAEMRKASSRDKVYQAMIEENYSAHKLLMRSYKALDLSGLVVIIENKICAYSLGCKLDRDTFCIMFEITDLSRKGLAQYIFKRMCELRSETYINTMDDSGIANLRKSKLSYRPYKEIGACAASIN